MEALFRDPDYELAQSRKLRGTKAAINIKLYTKGDDPGNRVYQDAERDATVYPSGLAIYKSPLKWNDRFSGYEPVKYRVTHAPTGLAIGEPFVHLESARLLVYLLRDLDWNFKRAKDMPEATKQAGTDLKLEAEAHDIELTKAA